MKVVNIQLDAASPLFIYANLGKLPFLAGKVLNGTSGILFCHGSSSISWTSFWTGQSPAVHGIWGFWHEGAPNPTTVETARRYLESPGEFLKGSSQPLTRGIKRSLLAARPLLAPLVRLALRSFLSPTRGRRPNNRIDVKSTMAYELMQRAGLRVGLVNSIYTYPAWDINGQLVCDWTMPVGASDYYYPAELGEYLDRIGYRRTLDASKQYWGWLEGSMSDDRDAIHHWATEVFEKVKQITIHLLSERSWDFHATMFRYLDTMQHIYIDDPERMLEAYQRVDAGLAEIAAATGLDSDEDVCWLLNSDHGMTQFWDDRTIKGGHDLAGFYCFARPGTFRVNHRYSLHIEQLMPIVTHLLGIESLHMPFNPSLGENLFAPPDQEEADVEARLRALGYLS